MIELSHAPAYWKLTKDALVLNDVPSSCPMAYRVNGKQYLAVVVGNGGAQASTWPPLVLEIQNPPDCNVTLWVFELP